VDAAEWVVVSMAGLLAAGTIGVLLTLPLWSDGNRPPLVPAILSAHAGLVAVLGITTVAAAARSWQLVGEDPSEHASGLLQVSRIDGDGSMYALLVLALAFGTTLAVVALSLAARFSAGDDPFERLVASAVLALEVCVGGYGAARLGTGSHSVAVVILTLHLPLAMYALVRCWPPAEPLLER
jgi:hypothetical protein